MSLDLEPTPVEDDLILRYLPNYLCKDPFSKVTFTGTGGSDLNIPFWGIQSVGKCVCLQNCVELMGCCTYLVHIPSPAYLCSSDKDGGIRGKDVGGQVLRRKEVNPPCPRDWPPHQLSSIPCFKRNCICHPCPQELCT